MHQEKKRDREFSACRCVAGARSDFASSSIQVMTTGKVMSSSFIRPNLGKRCRAARD